MEFRQVLQVLGAHFGKQGFKARDISPSVISSPITESARFTEDPTILSEVSTKSISNELRRLYLMGFLKRKRIKRECETKSGKTCFRGYEYDYSISRKGWNYLDYLNNPERRDDESFLSSADHMALDDLTKNYPADEWWLAWDVGKTAAENPDPEKALAIGIQLELMQEHPRDRWEKEWNLWKEMNIKSSKRRFSKREGIDKALVWGAIRGLKEKNKVRQKVIEEQNKGISWLSWETVWLIRKNEERQKVIEAHQRNKEVYQRVIKELSEGKSRLIKTNKSLEAGLEWMGEYFQASLRRPR